MQILVLVANIQVRTLKTEVEKGFMRTVIDHELVDPKAQVNSVTNDHMIYLVVFMRRKGIRVNIPEPLIGYFYGNVSEYGDDSRCPGKSSLFFLTVF